MRRLLAVAVLVAACSDTGPSGLTIKNASTLATTLSKIDAVVATPQLRGLTGMTIPTFNAGIDVHNMDSTVLGKTVAWDPLHAEIIFTTRAGAPVNAMRIVLYTNDSTGRPAYPPVEVGYADLYPHNTFNGGGPDSTSLRFIVTDTRGALPVVVADFIAHHHADSACVQCATVEGWASDAAGTTRVNFVVSYNIPIGLDGQFPGAFNAPGLAFTGYATLPGPGVSTSIANVTFAFAGDTLSTLSGLLRPHAGQLIGDTDVRINGTHFATVTRSATGITGLGPNGRALTHAELEAAGGMLAVPADIAYYIEWPTFVIFFCGC